MTVPTSESLANLVATIDSVAAGESFHDESDDDDHDDDHHDPTNMITAELMEDGTVGMLEGTVLHLSNGQSINVMEMTGPLDDSDSIGVVQVETDDFDEEHDLTTTEELCEIDIDSEEQQHILSETGAHVVVKTESAFSEKDPDHATASTSERSSSSMVLPTVPFSFPGQTFDIKCQKLILNVWDFFRRLKKNPDLLDEIRTPQERAAAALHISAATIGKIGKNFKRIGKLETPGRNRQRTKPVLDSVTPDQQQVIRGIIKDLKESRVVPTLPILLSECREKINFQGGPTSFRRLLRRMGYKGLSNKMSSNSSSSKSKSVNSAPASTNTASSSRPKVLQMESPEPKVKKEPCDYISIPLLTSPISQSPVKKVTGRKKAKSSKANAALTFTTNSSTVPVSISKQHASKLVTNLLGNNIFQFSDNAKGESITISEQTAAAIANATSGLGEGPQTIHVLNPDNSVQQIQIVYANIQ